jgi:hypothetical protein
MAAVHMRYLGKLPKIATRRLEVVMIGAMSSAVTGPKKQR